MTGEHLGHYRVIRRIGEGGVGHVYLAEDLRLDRKVALKVLAQANPNPEQVARFEREAKAAAALNHPNILAIHDFGHDASVPYVVMELLDGRNLRQVLEEGPLPTRRAVEYALHIVSALEAAHEKGISHRDLKPANIFVTDDGRVKILDFGLASVRGTSHGSGADDATREELTAPGLILGTVGYMAPEQIRGEQADSRTDIFALGAVLFEMLTARRAFDEPTAVETMHAILKIDPPLHLLNASGVPAQLVRIISRCLEKRCADRFQSARDVGTALHAVQSGVPEADSTAADRLDSWKEIASYLGRGVRTVQRWEREEQLPVHRLTHSKGGSVYAHPHELKAWWESRRVSLSETPPSGPGAPVSDVRASPHMERVTYTSTVTLSPALSSDARMLVYISDGGAGETAPQVWLQQVGGAAMRLTSGLHDCGDPSFSADDRYVRFTARGAATLNVYEIPTLGGEPRLLKRNAKGARTSPDGRWLSYISLEDRCGFRVAPRDGDARLVAPELMDVSSAIWSPDSRYILARGHPDASFDLDYWVVPLDDRAPIDMRIAQRLKGHATVIDTPPAWVDSSFVFAAGTRHGVFLFRQRFAPESFELLGDPEPITAGIEWADFPTASAGRLAFVNARQNLNLWSIPLDATTGIANGPPQRLTRGPGLTGHLSITADENTLSFFSIRGGQPELLLRDLLSGKETPVAAEPGNAFRGYPALSPAGAQLAHGTVTPGPRALRPIVIVDLANGSSRRLSEDSGGRPRQWLDERYLLIETFGTRLNTLVLVDTWNGSQQDLLRSGDRSVSNPCLSHDRRWIAFDAARPGGSPMVFVAPLNRDAPIPESAWIPIDEAASHPFWSTGDDLLYYLPTIPSRELRVGARGRRVSASQGKPQGDSFAAVTLKELLIPTFVAGTAPIVARDQLICVLVDLSGDIWIMSM